MPLQNGCETDNRVRVLIVDDYKPWHRFISSILRTQAELSVVAQAFDGFEGVQQAQKLQPNLILLDVGLPGINGIQAARRIREVSPESRILVVSQTRDAQVAEAALAMGACGYVVKSNAGRELLPAIDAVLKGERFLSACLHMSISNSVGADDYGGRARLLGKKCETR